MVDIPTTVVHKNEKPSSYEFGKAGNRWKIYFEDAVDLRKQIDELTKQAFVISEI